MQEPSPIIVGLKAVPPSSSKQEMDSKCRLEELDEDNTWLNQI